jgi:hypothetical protein
MERNGCGLIHVPFWKILGGLLRKSTNAQSRQLVFCWRFEIRAYGIEVTAISASSTFVQFCKWQNIVVDKLRRKAIDVEFLWGTAFEKSPRKILLEREG